MPDLRFDIRRIDVAGPPWATLATIEWIETKSAIDGVVISTAGVHGVTRRWGRMTRPLVLRDTAGLTGTLNRICGKAHVRGTGHAHCGRAGLALTQALTGGRFRLKCCP